MLPGAVVGWLVSESGEQVPGGGVQGVQLGLRAASPTSTAVASAGPCGSALIVLVIYVGLFGTRPISASRSVPSGFIPSQDKGYLLVNIQLPDSSSLERTVEVAGSVEKIAHEIAGCRTHDVDSRTVVRAQCGQLELCVRCSSFSSRSTIATEPSCRPTQSPCNCAAACTQKCKEAMVAVFGAPPVDGLGNAGGFKLMVEDQRRRGARRLARTGRRPGRTGQRPARASWA